MLTYRGLIDDATKQLYESCDTPRIDAEVLMQHVIKKPLAWLIAYGDTVASSDHIATFYKHISERQNGQPVAYLLGQRDFWTLTLKVNENVLIPRPDTETLVEQALEKLPSKAQSNVLDLGTGSGAIALAIAKERSQSKVLAVDAHAEALAVAKENAQLNAIDNVSFLQSNWFNEVSLDDKFELIAANPPYVEDGDPHLGSGDLRFEPKTALVAKENGLADLRNIIQAAPQYLKNDGWLIVEHGYNQADQVGLMFDEANYQHVSHFDDINGLARCTLGQQS